MANEHVTVGKWKDYINYQCNHCAFATIAGLDAILNHLTIHFPNKPRPSIRGLLLADSWGREIERPDEGPVINDVILQVAADLTAADEEE